MKAEATALPAELLEDPSQLLPHRDHPSPDLQARLLNDPEDVPLRLGSRGPDDEVGAAKEEQMEGVVFEHEGVIDQFADLSAR